jgi:hypothetical protein
MTSSSAPVSGSVDTPATAPDSARKLSTPAPSAPNGPWMMAALVLASAAQLITISALMSVDPLAATWASLLLAIAPGPLAAVAAYAPAPVSLPAAVAGVGVLVAGIAGEITHIGAFFLPALVLLAIGAVLLWSERSRPGSAAAVS